MYCWANPKMLRDVHHQTFHKPEVELAGVELQDAIERVLRLPTVASKAFLITIGDRTITGMVARDQMVGLGKYLWRMLRSQ